MGLKLKLCMVLISCFAVTMVECQLMCPGGRIETRRLGKYCCYDKQTTECYKIVPSKSIQIADEDGDRLILPPGFNLSTLASLIPGLRGLLGAPGTATGATPTLPGGLINIIRQFLPMLIGAQQGPAQGGAQPAPAQGGAQPAPAQGGAQPGPAQGGAQGAQVQGILNLLQSVLQQARPTGTADELTNDLEVNDEWN